MLARLFTDSFAFSKGDSVVVIGLGRFGGAVANSLMQLGHDVTGIDRDTSEIQLRPIFEFVRTGTGPKGQVLGEFRATGYLPSFLQLFIVMGLVKKGEPYL